VLNRQDAKKDEKTNLMWNREWLNSSDLMAQPQAIALPEANVGFTVVIPALGCATQGDTIEKAQANAVESAEARTTSQHKRMNCEAILGTQG
jgi:hypothetical protein